MVAKCLLIPVPPLSVGLTGAWGMVSLAIGGGFFSGFSVTGFGWGAGFVVAIGLPVAGVLVVAGLVVVGLVAATGLFGIAGLVGGLVAGTGLFGGAALAMAVLSLCAGKWTEGLFPLSFSTKNGSL